jgi:molybdopterin-binding protein
MEPSARNQVKGIAVAIERGDVVAEVAAAIGHGR